MAIVESQSAKSGQRTKRMMVRWMCGVSLKDYLYALWKCTELLVYGAWLRWSGGNGRNVTLLLRCCWLKFAKVFDQYRLHILTEHSGFGRLRWGGSTPPLPLCFNSNPVRRGRLRWFCDMWIVTSGDVLSVGIKVYM